MDNPDVLSSVKAGLEGVSEPVDGLEYCGPVSGGIVNQASLFKTRHKRYFVKWNTKECKSRENESRITEPVFPDPVEKFGFHRPTYLGNFTPGVVWRDTWAEYFIRDIMNGLFNLVNEKYGNQQVREGWSALQLHVHKVFSNMVISPEILHGDLCPANFGQTDTDLVLFDPSCLYGDPDFDLFLSVAEGGFHDDFFTSYRSLVPQCQGRENKMTVYRLFYYLIMWCHVDEEQFKEGTIKSISEVECLLSTL